jgi:hypothetical protein
LISVEKGTLYGTCQFIPTPEGREIIGDFESISEITAIWPAMEGKNLDRNCPNCMTEKFANPQFFNHSILFGEQKAFFLHKVANPCLKFLKNPVSHHLQYRQPFK